MSDGAHTQCDNRSHHNQRCPKMAVVLFTFADAGVRPRAACVEHAPPMREALLTHLPVRQWWESALR